MKKLKKKQLFLIGLLLLIIVTYLILTYFNSEDQIVSDEEKITIKIADHISGEINAMGWANNDQLLIASLTGGLTGENSSQLYVYDLQNNSAEEIYQVSGWRTLINILRLDHQKQLIAVELNNDLLLLDYTGLIKLEIKEAGRETALLFDQEMSNLIYTEMAEWELPTNLIRYNLANDERVQLTNYEFGQNFKVGSFDFDDQYNLYFIEQFAYGTMSKGGRNLYQIKADETELVWQGLAAEQIAKFRFFAENKFLALTILWDDDGINQQSYLKAFALDQEEALWAIPLDEMGQDQLWYNRHPLSFKGGYQQKIVFCQNYAYITALKEDYVLYIVELREGEIISEKKAAGFPRLNATQDKLLYADFSATDVCLQIVPLTN